MASWLIRKTGNDNNGGSSAAVRVSVTDGVTNGTNTLTSASALFTAGDVGHGIFIGGVNVWRTVATYVSATNITFSGATIASGSGRTVTVGGAWQTIAKGASSVTPLAAGDTVYIGAGVYRETVTFGVSGSNGSPITYVGDVDGAQTGDAGEVRLTNFTVNDRSPATGTFLTFTSRTYLAFQHIHFNCGTGTAATIPNTANNITFTNCALVSNANNSLFSATAGASVPINLVIDSCFIWCHKQSAIAIAAPTSSTGADYDVGVTIKNNVILGTTTFTPSGALAKLPGGVVYENNLCIVNGAMFTTAASSSTTIPCLVANNVYVGNSSAIVANTLGQATDKNNAVLVGVANTNATADPASIPGSVGAANAALLLHFGQEAIWGGLPRPFGAPFPDAPHIGMDSTATPAALTADILGKVRPGATIVLDSGTATAGAARTLTDSGKNWGLNAYIGRVVKITGGTGSGQLKTITSHTATVLTVDGNWQTNPDNTSTYRIIDANGLASTGTATAGSTTTCTDGNAAWGTNMWAGYTISVTAGTGNGQTAVISSNTGTVLTFPAVGVGLDSTSKYSLYRAASLNAVRGTPGPYELHDRPKQEAATVDASTYAVRLSGAGTCDIRVPVNNASTVITVRSRFDSEHGTGTKPQATIVADQSIGVSAQTITGTALVDTWETLTFTAIVPTAKSWVTLRLAARATNADGAAYFDTITVT